MVSRNKQASKQAPLFFFLYLGSICIGCLVQLSCIYLLAFYLEIEKCTYELTKLRRRLVRERGGFLRETFSSCCRFEKRIGLNVFVLFDAMQRLDWIRCYIETPRRAIVPYLSFGPT